MPQQDAGQYIRGWPRAFATVAVALVWLYEGLWCKLLSGCPSQAVVVSLLPQPFGHLAGRVLTGIGATEVAIALWVLSGRKARLAAVAQTLLIIVMNGGGLLWGRAAIEQPGRMVTQNLVLLALAWTIADERI